MATEVEFFETQLMEWPRDLHYKKAYLVNEINEKNGDFELENYIFCKVLNSFYV